MRPIPSARATAVRSSTLQYPRSSFTGTHAGTPHRRARPWADHRRSSRLARRPRRRTSATTSHCALSVPQHAGDARHATCNLKRAAYNPQRMQHVARDRMHHVTCNPHCAYFGGEQPWAPCRSDTCQGATTDTCHFETAEGALDTAEGACDGTLSDRVRCVRFPAAAGAGGAPKPPAGAHLRHSRAWQRALNRICVPLWRCGPAACTVALRRWLRGYRSLSRRDSYQLLLWLVAADEKGLATSLLSEAGF